MPWPSIPAPGRSTRPTAPRYRVLCFQPRFRFRSSPLSLRNDEPASGITGTGGLAPLRFSIVGGALPAGLGLDAETGLIRGVPRDEPGRYEVEIAVATATGTTRETVHMELEPDESTKGR